MKIYVDAEVDPIDLSNQLYEDHWRNQAEFVITVIKGLESDAVSEIGDYIAEALGKEMTWKVKPDGSD